MKKLTNIFILLLVLITFESQAQKNWKKYLICGSTSFVSGMMDGTIESINYHYHNGFKTRYKNANDQFWNPELSWKNKYLNGDPKNGPKFYGSTTSLVFTTDAYHLLRTSKRSLDGATLVYMINKDCSKKIERKRKFKNLVKDFAVLTAIRCAGFHLTYSVMFKVNNN
jgi:hypothetical protein